MDPKPIEKELLEQEEEGALAARKKPSRVHDFPVDYIWALTNSDLLALTRDEYCGFWRMVWTTLNSSRPGIMGEEQVRVWTGYTPDEWTAHRPAFLPLFRLRPDGTWTLTVLRTVFLAQQRRLRKARKAALEANRKRWQHKAKRAARNPTGVRSDELSDASEGVRPESLFTQGVKTGSKLVRAPVPDSPPISPGGPAPGLLPAAASLALIAGVMARTGGGSSSP